MAVSSNNTQNKDRRGKEHKRSAREYSQVIRESTTSRNPLATFMVMPKGVSVEIQDEDEVILLLVRRHVITNIKWILVALVLGMAPIFFGAFPFYEVLLPTFRLMTVLLWYLLTTAVVLEGFFNWYFDVFIVTDERIIDVDFKNLIYKNITTTKIERIEDVTYSVSGALPSFLNYGNVLIQTASAGISLDPQDTAPFMEIINTPRPAKVAKLINELMLEEEQEKIEGRVR
jgi:hypothetical protein